MKLSVIVPVYNMIEGGRLAFCLDSLLNQTLPEENFEIIAIDDCSTDRSYELLREYAGKYPSRFVVRKTPKNLRQGGAKNMGLSLARGEWIGFVDSDDFVAPSFYETLLVVAEAEDADVAGCDLYRTRTHSFDAGYEIIHNNREEQDGVLSVEKKQSLILDGGFLPAKIFRRHIIFGDSDLFLQSGKNNRADVFPENMFYEDNVVAPLWMLRAARFSYVQEPLYYYYQSEHSTTNTVTTDRLHERMRAANMMLERAEREGFFAKYHSEFEYRFTHLFYINTLFSAMQTKGLEECYSFTESLLRDMDRRFPNFDVNPYYIERTPEEEKKLIAMQRQSHRKFYLYYRALWAYRHAFRKGGNAQPETKD